MVKQSFTYSYFASIFHISSLYAYRFLRSRAGPAPGGAGPAIDMLGPPINKLTLMKTAVFVLKFQILAHP